MKKKLLILFLFISALGVKAQEIDSIVVTPALPDANDPITVYVYLSFPQGTCADVGTVFVSGNDIYGNGFHCMGNIMSICYDVDTLLIAPLAAGNYNLYFSLDAGFGPPGNCSAGFQPYDVDTVSIAVSTVLGTPETPATTISIYPNPAAQYLFIDFPGGTIAKVQLLNLLGEEVLATEPQAGSTDIPVAGLAEGIYFCRITDVSGNLYVHQVEIVR